MVKLPVFKEKPYVEKAELTEAVERVGSGPERRSMKITDKEKRIVAKLRAERFQPKR